MQYYAKIKKQKSGEFLVVFPDLPGCLTDGKTLAEAKANASEAMNLWLSPSCEMDCPTPKPKRRTGKDYYPIQVDKHLIPILLIRLMRQMLSLSPAQAARKVGIDKEDYIACERLRSSARKRA